MLRRLMCVHRLSGGVELPLTSIILSFASQLKLSTISPARSAFTLFTFEPAFFSKYKVTAKPERRGEQPAVQLQILGKVS